MKKISRSWMAALVLVVMVSAMAAPAFAAPAHSTSRAPGVRPAGFLSELLAEVYSEIRGWLGDSGLQSATEAGGGGMDPNGTSAPTPTSSSSSVLTSSPSGGLSLGS